MLPAHFCKIFTQPSTLDMNGKGYDRQFLGQQLLGCVYLPSARTAEIRETTDFCKIQARSTNSQNTTP
ncbi:MULTISPECIES: hypothetical protein [unclassified Microcoleus]|uniref:hypothetical protein n=1 Tax=unclassified Microcoleus TaxID=2642155 RepID=UPI002FD35621